MVLPWRLQPNARVSGAKFCPQEPGGQDRTGGKIGKIGEIMGVAPNNLIHERVSLAGWAGKFGVSRFLQIVDKTKEFVFYRAKLVGSPVGDTEEFDGIVVQASFYRPVSGGADLDVANGP